jgi:hypothetical protein
MTVNGTTGAINVPGAFSAGSFSIAAINNTPIGSTTPSTGAFTTLSATTPIGVISGGTGANTGPAALTNLGAAASGSNADITSMSGLTGAINGPTSIAGATAGMTVSNVNSINGGQLAGLRNRIINGGMAVDQRNSGSSQTITAGAALAYCVDRWYAYCTGANVTGQRVAGSGNTQYRYQFTGAASVTKIGFAQRIEAANSYDLNSRTITLGVELANSLLTTVTWTAWYANSADTFGTLASPTRTSIGTGSITVTNTPTRYYVPITLPAGATTGIEIEFSVGAQISGTWTIGEAQLVAGSANELWREQRPYGMELALCQRYALAFGANGMYGVITLRTGGIASYGVIPTPVQMRTLPQFSGSVLGFCGDTSTGLAITPNYLNGNSVFISATHLTLGSNGQCALIFANGGPNFLISEL